MVYTFRNWRIAERLPPTPMSIPAATNTKATICQMSAKGTMVMMEKISLPEMPLVARTIFMMAMSSRRSKAVSLMVLAMMNTDTKNSTDTKAILTMAAMLRMVIKPLEISS